MAKNKKSFVIYCDLIHTVEKLPDEKAGKLMKHLLRYVNDMNPECDDMMVDLVFEGIKQQLKRDLKHWEEVRIVKSEVGRIGGLKSGESRRKKQSKQVLQKGSKTNQNEANEAVTVNVNDNVINNIPTLQEFLDYCKSLEGIDYSGLEFSLKSKYETWVEAKWIDGNGKKINNWKSKIKNTIPYLKPIKNLPVSDSIQYSL